MPLLAVFLFLLDASAFFGDPAHLQMIEAFICRRYSRKRGKEPDLEAVVTGNDRPKKSYKVDSCFERTDRNSKLVNSL